MCSGCYSEWRIMRNQSPEKIEAALAAAAVRLNPAAFGADDAHRDISEAPEVWKEKPMPTPKVKKQIKVLPCKNCRRVMPITGREMCGGCYSEWRNVRNQSPETIAAALSAAARRLNPDGVEKPAGTIAGNVIAGTPAPVAGTTTEAIDCIALIFHFDDKPLYDAILAEARRNRRDPDQHILWVMQEVIESREEALCDAKK